MNGNLGKFVYTIGIKNTISNELKKVEKTTEKIGDKTNKNTKAINGFSSGITYARKNVIAFEVSLYASLKAFDMLMSSGSKFANNIQNISMSSGIATSDLQMMSNAYSNIANISTDKAQDDLKNLSTSINEIKMGLKSPEDFYKIGVSINAKSNVSSVFNDLRAKVANKSDMQSVMILKQIGLDENFLKLLRASSSEIQKLNSIPILSEKQINQTIQAGREINAVKKQIISFKNIAIANISPIVSAEFNKFFHLINNNKDSIIKFFERSILYIKDFGIAIGKTVMLGVDFINMVSKSTYGLEIMTIAIAGLSLSAFPLLATFGALVLLADDFKTWREGGISAFGGVYSSIEKLMPMIKNLGEAFAVIIGGSFGFLAINKVISFFDSVLKIAKYFVPAFSLVLSPLAKNPVILALAAIGAGIWAGSKIYDFFTNKDDINSVNSYIPNAINEKGMSYSPFINRQNPNESANINNTNTFNIEGNDDEYLVRRIKEVLEEQNRFTNNSINFGY